MKLVLGISRDGYIARSANDDMRWLGANDKAAFKLLTSTGGGVLGVSKKTALCMPNSLPGRRLIKLSRNGITLVKFNNLFPSGWLIGGQTLALEAIDCGYLTEIYLCRSDRFAFPCQDDKPIADRVTSRLRPGWSVCVTTHFGDTSVECWRRDWH